jgi:hypothetical protein
MNSFKGVIVDRQALTLYEHATIGGQAGMFDFTHDVYWLRSASAETVLLHGGVQITRFSTYCDGGAFLSCIEDALRSYQAACDLYRIDSGSTLEVAVRVTINDTPYIAQSPRRQQTSEAPADLARIDKPWYFNESEGLGQKAAPVYHLIERKAFIADMPVLSSLAHLQDQHGTELALRQFIDSQRELASKRQEHQQ